MSTSRRIAVITGVLFIVATVGNLASAVLLTPILTAPDYLTRISADEGRVLIGALFFFIGAIACPAIAIALYPVLRKANEGLALGSVGFRLIEGMLYVVSFVLLLLLVTVSRDVATAGARGSSAFEVPASLLLAGRDWLGPVAAVLTFGIGAFMYYWVFYQTRLVPRWLSAWGLVGVTLVMLAGLLVMFDLAAPKSATQVVLALPIAVQEMVLAVWLIVKGFNPGAIASESAIDTSGWRAASPTYQPS